jgi:hypothetical protein
MSRRCVLAAGRLEDKASRFRCCLSKLLVRLDNAKFIEFGAKRMENEVQTKEQTWAFVTKVTFTGGH